MANEFQTASWPNLTLADSTNDSLQRAMTAVIQTLQMLTAGGQKTRGGQQPDRNMQHTFVQSDAPTAYNKGDFWLADKNFNVWTGERWQKVCDLP